MALEHRQGTLGRLQILPGLGEGLPVRAGEGPSAQLREQSLPSLGVLVGLVNLHTAHPLQQLQQRLPVAAHGQQPQPLHFDDCHQLFTTFSTMNAAAWSSRPRAFVLNSSHSCVASFSTSRVHWAASASALAIICRT